MEQLRNAVNTLFNKFQLLAAKMDADVEILKQHVMILTDERNKLHTEIHRMKSELEQLKKVVLTRAKADLAVMKVMQRSEEHLDTPAPPPRASAPKVVNGEVTKVSTAPGPVSFPAEFFEEEEEERA